jgi:hypothetical protein
LTLGNNTLSQESAECSRIITAGGGVKVVVALAAGTAEVDRRSARLMIDGDRDPQLQCASKPSKLKGHAHK